MRDYYIKAFFELEIGLNRLRKSGKITKREEDEIRLILKPLRYKVYLSSPEFQDNEKLKKEAKIVCLNDYLRCVGLSKKIRYVNCEINN